MIRSRHGSATFDEFVNIMMLMIVVGAPFAGAAIFWR